MKKLRSICLVAALFCASFLCLSLATGCSGTPNRKAYVAVGATTATVKASIDAFNDWRAVHPLTPAQAQGYANALKAYVDACEVVRKAENSVASSNNAGVDSLTIAQNAAGAAGDALLSFIADIAPLIVKTPTK